MSKKLPRFYQLLREAHTSQDAVDAFDLHSEDPASVAAFAKLTGTASDAANALLNYVNTNDKAIRMELASVSS